MRRILITTVIAFSAVTLAGCSMSGATSADSMIPSQVAPNSVPGPAPELEAGGAATDSSGVLDSDVVAGPRIITTVQLTITVDKPIEAADDAVSIVDRAGGTVESRSESAPSENEIGTAQLTLRIPSARLTATLEELKELGVARNTTINSTDVTSQSQDLDARIAALRTSVDRLLELMSKADSTESLITIESALTERQANLDALESQKRYLDDQVALSTVSLYLVSEQDTPADTPDTFWTGLVTGWSAFVGFLSTTLVVIGVLLPWLVAAGIVAAIVVVWVKLASGRKSRKTSAP